MMYLFKAGYKDLFLESLPPPTTHVTATISQGQEKGGE